MSAVIQTDETALPIEGVGILRYPSCMVMVQFGDGIAPAKDIAQEIASQIKRGSIVTLPCDTDNDGRYLWDIRIEAGDPGQVEVRRSEE